MESQRYIVATAQSKNDITISIHALEIIKNMMTGVYFHICFENNYDFAGNMYYLFDYEGKDKDFSVKEFMNFIGDSDILTLTDCEKNILEIVKNEEIIKGFCKYTELSKYAKKYKIDENTLDKGGIISCTLLGRIICEEKIE